MKILYVDGGCSASNQKDINKRKMVYVVADENGKILVEKTKDGGSCNIAEFYATLEALKWLKKRESASVKIITDSMVNYWWTTRPIGKKRYAKMNDGTTVRKIKEEVDRLMKETFSRIEQQPREINLAGHFIESKYGL